MTSIEWLRKELWEQFKFSFSDNIFEQAKEMHKKEIIEAWEDGIDSFSTRSSEQYYQQTFKKD
jgi:hypothetical protein